MNFFRPGENSTMCSPEVYMKCADKVLNYLVEEDTSICVCDTPCKNTRYQLESSMLQLPSNAAAEFLAWKLNKTVEYVHRNIAKLNGLLIYELTSILYLYFYFF